MGKMQNNLASILRQLGKSVYCGDRYHFPTQQDVASSRYAEEVQRIYKSLGGCFEQFTFDPRRTSKWDIRLGEGIVIELDECLHFNRYRKITLEEATQVYENYLSNFPHLTYRDFCDLYEAACLCAGDYGKKWKTSYSIKQFGSVGVDGDLSQDGAPRWKQRAFYDFIKDLSPLIIHTPLARISMWDKVEIAGKKIPVGEVLLTDNVAAGSALYELVKQRTCY